MKKNYSSRDPLFAKIRALFALMCLAVQLNAQIELVKDINGASDPYVSEFSLVHEVGDVIYFVYENDLWKSDVEGNATKVKDFASVAKLVNIGDDLIIFADDGVAGTEVWPK